MSYGNGRQVNFRPIGGAIGLVDNTAHNNYRQHPNNNCMNGQNYGPGAYDFSMNNNYRDNFPSLNINPDSMLDQPLDLVVKRTNVTSEAMGSRPIGLNIVAHESQPMQRMTNYRTHRRPPLLPLPYLYPPHHQRAPRPTPLMDLDLSHFRPSRHVIRDAQRDAQPTPTAHNRQQKHTLLRDVFKFTQLNIHLKSWEKLPVSLNNRFDCLMEDITVPMTNENFRQNLISTKAKCNKLICETVTLHLQDQLKLVQARLEHANVSHEEIDTAITTARKQFKDRHNNKNAPLAHQHFTRVKQIINSALEKPQHKQNPQPIAESGRNTHQVAGELTTTAKDINTNTRNNSDLTHHPNVPTTNRFAGQDNEVLTPRKKRDRSLVEPGFDEPVDVRKRAMRTTPVRTLFSPRRALQLRRTPTLIPCRLALLYLLPHPLQRPPTNLQQQNQQNRFKNRL